MIERINKEITLIVKTAIVTISTQRKMTWKEVLLFPLPYIIVFTLIFGLKQDLIRALLLGLSSAVFLTTIFLLFRVSTSFFYWHFKFNLEKNTAIKKSFQFGKLKKELPLVCNENQLYLRDVSRSAWKSCILTYIPDLEKDETLSLLVIKQETAIQKIQEHLNLHYREKKNKNSFFDN